MVNEHASLDDLVGREARGREFPLRQFGQEGHRIKVVVQGKERLHRLNKRLVPAVHSEGARYD